MTINFRDIPGALFKWPPGTCTQIGKRLQYQVQVPHRMPYFIYYNGRYVNKNLVKFERRDRGKVVIASGLFRIPKQSLT